MNVDRMPSPYFISVDAESDIIAAGVDVIDGIRCKLEERCQTTLPITWFVHMQRRLKHYMKQDDPNFFAESPVEPYDRFELAGEALDSLQKRGDQIGWHYHAYNYVHRPDLSHQRRLEILRQDLKSCAAYLRSRYSRFGVRAFRFGWFFNPDYRSLETLAEVGIDVDASVDAARAGRVADFECEYLSPPSPFPGFHQGLLLAPAANSVLIHDWNVLPHDFGWRSASESEARQLREKFAARVEALVERARREGGRLTTYADWHCEMRETDRPEH